MASESVKAYDFSGQCVIITGSAGVLGSEMAGAPRAEGVDADPERYIPLHRQMLYRGASYYEKATGYKWPYAPIREIEYKDSDFPVAVDLFTRLISLPTFTHDCRDVLDQYIEAFHKVVENADQLVE